MFFKQILILFVIMGVLGFIYGDRVLNFQANLMLNWQYDFPAYEAYERIIRYYPSSIYRMEAQKMMEILVKRNHDLRKYLEIRDKDIRKLEKERAKQEANR